MVSKHTKLNRTTGTDAVINEYNICTQAFASEDNFKDEDFLFDNPSIYPSAEEVKAVDTIKGNESLKEREEKFPDWMYVNAGARETRYSKYPRFYAIIAKMHEDYPNAVFDLECYDDTPNNIYQFHLAVANYKRNHPNDHRIKSATFNLIDSENFNSQPTKTKVPLTEQTLSEVSFRNTIPEEIKNIVYDTLEKLNKIQAAVAPAAAAAAAAAATPAAPAARSRAVAAAANAAPSNAVASSEATASRKTMGKEYVDFTYNQPPASTIASFLIKALKTIAKILFNVLLIASGIGIIPLAINIKKTGRPFFFEADIGETPAKNIRHRVKKTPI